MGVRVSPGSNGNGSAAFAFHTWWIMVPMLLLPTWSSVRHMTYDLLWVDEVLTYHGSGGAQYDTMSVQDIVLHAIYYDPWWPPFYYSTLRIWGSVAGWTPLANRYLSLLFGSLVVALVYQLGHRLHSDIAEILAALLLSTSLFFGYYLHELRGYTLHLLFAVLVVWTYVQVNAHDQQAPRRRRVGFTMSLVGLLYSHSFGILVVASLGLYHLLFARRNAQWHNTVKLMVIGGLFFLPWFAIPTIGALIAEYQNPRTMPILTLLEVALKTFGNGLPLMFGALIIFGALRLRHPSARLLAILLFSMAGLALAINVVFQYLFHIRHLLVLMPFTVLLLAMTLVEVYRTLPLAAYAFVVLWIAAGVYHIENRTFNEHQPDSIASINAASFLETLDVLKARSIPEDAIFIQIGQPHHEQHNFAVLDFYLGETGLRYAQTSGIKHFKADVRDLPFAEKFDDFVDGATRIWTVTMPTQFPAEDYAPLMNEIHNRNYHHCGIVFANADFTIDAYSSDRCDEPQTLAHRTDL